MRPKAIGSWNLDAASRGLRHLDHFVFFSSIVATQGNAGEQSGRQPLLCKPCLASFCLQHAFTMGERDPRSAETALGAAAGQTSYGFANMYGSELCRARRAAGLPGLSIGWGPIGNVGVMAEADKVRSCTPDTSAQLPQQLPLQAPALESFSYSSSPQLCRATHGVLATCNQIRAKAHQLLRAD